MKFFFFFLFFAWLLYFKKNEKSITDFFLVKTESHEGNGNIDGTVKKIFDLRDCLFDFS